MNNEGLYLHLSADRSEIDRGAERRDLEWVTARERANAQHAEQVARNALAAALRRVGESTVQYATSIEIGRHTGTARAYVKASLVGLQYAREQHAAAVQALRKYN